jgi:hypothetical protein
MQAKRNAAIAESARPFLEGGETVRGVFVGQTFCSPIWYLILLPIFLLAVIRMGVIITTDRNVYQFRMSMWSVKKVTDLLHKTPLSAARAVPGPTWSLQVEEGPRLYALLGTNKYRQEVLAQVHEASGTPSADQEATVSAPTEPSV